MALVLRRLGRVELARSFYRDIKNDNDFDIKVVVGVGLNFGEDAFYIK